MKMKCTAAYELICIVPSLPEFQHLGIFISDEIPGFHFFKGFVHGEVEIPIQAVLFVKAHQQLIVSHLCNFS